ncbi:MAG: flippase-like domain-containing protein [Bdellovibrionales bacterium]|nr:flippase-like domain-containing protein [Bdellovibrionales bacterium]
METSSGLPVKERIKLFLKFSLVGAVFWWLYHKGLVTVESFQRLLSSPFYFGFALFFMAINTLCGTLRWQVLLKTQGAILSFGRVLRLTLIGSFFNIALPGAVSGDFVKAMYVARDFPDKRASVFGSMVFDRLLGVSAMIFVGAFSALLSLVLPWGGSLPPVLLYAIGVLGLGVLLFFVYLFMSHKTDPLFKLLQFFTRRNEKLGAVDRLYQGVMSYRANPKRVLKAIALSISIHVLLIMIAFLISESISPAPIPLLALAVIVPIGMLATTIPILPAGVGTGHAAFLALFKLVGSDRGAEVFSLIVFFQVLVGLVGGVAYLKIHTEKLRSGAALQKQANQ